MTKLPERLYVIVTSALIGEIYPAIRAIAVGYSLDSKVLLFRAYFDREPTPDDEENMEVIMTNISSMTSRAEIASAEIECHLSEAPVGKLDLLDELVYARSEIAPAVPYLSGPYTWSDQRSA